MDGCLGFASLLIARVRWGEDSGPAGREFDVWEPPGYGCAVHTWQRARLAH
jgi:hypothetical protein